MPASVYHNRTLPCVAMTNNRNSSPLPAQPCTKILPQKIVENVQSDVKTRLIATTVGDEPKNV